MFPRFINSPAFQLSEKLNAQLGPLLNNPLERLYNGIAYRETAIFSKRYDTIASAIQNEEYFESLVKLWQTIELWVREFEADLSEIETRVKPIVRTYNEKIRERYLIDVEANMREFLIEIYLHTGLENLQYMLPDDLKKALIRFAKEDSSGFDKLVKGVEETLSVVASADLLPMPAPPSTLAELPSTKVTHRILVVLFDYCQRSKEIDLPSKKNVVAFGKSYGLSGLTFYEYRCGSRYGITTVNQLSDLDVLTLRKLLTSYPKALKLFDSEIVIK